MNIKKHIPNAITCGNLFCGCLAIVFAFQNNLVYSAYFVGIAAILDFFDGFAARLLKVSSEIGKQLDSLADMVTFGLVPAVVMFKIIQYSIDSSYAIDDIFSILDSEKIKTFRYLELLPYLAFFIAIFSAIRLAKFNIDTRQTSSFIGVPTPANAILICSFPLIGYFQPTFLNINISSIFQNIYFLIGTIVLMSYLLVAEIPLFALKFKNFAWANNKISYSFLIISLILLIVFHFIAIPFIIFLYIILSIINNTYNRNKKHHEI